MIAFIANSLEENHKGRVMPWPHMKEVIFRIYEQRVKWAPEVSGSINTSYLSLEEFLILHFLKEGKLRRTAELSIIDFITSLKYYAKLWPRAKMFACLCGMLKFGDTMETELSTSSCDIFVQEYYFYLLSLFYSDRTGWVESPDGVTYVRFDKEEEFSKAALDWMASSEAKKFTNKVRKYVKKMNEHGVGEIEYIDMDSLMSAYMDEFLLKKSKNKKVLTKGFVKYYQEQDGVFNIDEIKDIAHGVIPEETRSVFVRFAGEVCILRAFAFALMAGKNSYDITNKEFMEGCSRFGIDNPIPFIAKRLHLYGNDVDLERYVRKNLKEEDIEI